MRCGAPGEEKEEGGITFCQRGRAQPQIHLYRGPQTQLRHPGAEVIRDGPRSRVRAPSPSPERRAAVGNCFSVSTMNARYGSTIVVRTSRPRRTDLEGPYPPRLRGEGLLITMATFRMVSRCSGSSAR